MVTELLPQDRPRYLMGVGTPLDLLEAVHRGVDMFDCILPTALAKQGVAFTSKGRVDLRRAAYRDKEGPLDPACGCYTCKTYSMAYLFHLNRVHESHGWQLLGLHNIHFYMQLMRAMRTTYLPGTWSEFYHAQREVLDARDSYGPKPIRYSNVERKQRKLQVGRYEVVVRDSIGRIRDRQLRRSDALGERSGRGSALALCRAIEADRAIANCGWRAAGRVGCRARRRRQCHGDDSSRRSDEFGKRVRKLLLVSFENDLDSLKLALRHRRWFRHLQACRARTTTCRQSMDLRGRVDRVAAIGGRFRRAQVRRAAAGSYFLRSVFVQDG